MAAVAHDAAVSARSRSSIQDAILFFRLGDFYEMFFDDAKLVSQELELTLTGKDCGLSERAPMCGVPFHAVDTYLAAAHRKGLQGRHLRADERSGHWPRGWWSARSSAWSRPARSSRATCWRIRRPNYICLHLRSGTSAPACAFADVSTGEFYVYQILRRAGLRWPTSWRASRPARSSSTTWRPWSAWCRRCSAIARRVRRGDLLTMPHAAKCLKAHFGQTVDGAGLWQEERAVCRRGGRAAELSDGNAEKRADAHPVAASSYERAALYGAGPRGAAQSGADRDHPGAQPARLAAGHSRPHAQRPWAAGCCASGSNGRCCDAEATSTRGWTRWRALLTSPHEPPDALREAARAAFTTSSACSAASPTTRVNARDCLALLRHAARLCR